MVLLAHKVRRDNHPSHLLLLDKDKDKGQGHRQVDHRVLPPDHLGSRQHHGKGQGHLPSQLGLEDLPSICSDDNNSQSQTTTVPTVYKQLTT